MQNPRPIHLMTPEESRGLGWGAEARDSDGHLMSQHAPFGSLEEITDFVKERSHAGHTVTIWPEALKELK